MRGMERSARRAGGGQEEAMFTALIRTVILYILIIAGVRLMGKRQVGELEPSELVLSLLIADLASVPMQDLGIPLHAGVVPILALLSLTMILSVLTMKSIRFRTLMCGRPSIVVRDGKVDQGEMRRNRLTVDELLEELRGQGYTDLAGASWRPTAGCPSCPTPSRGRPPPGSWGWRAGRPGCLWSSSATGAFCRTT